MFVVVYGYDHPDVAATLVNTAGVYQQQVKYDETLDLYHEAEKVLVGVHDHEYLDVVKTRDAFNVFSRVLSMVFFLRASCCFPAEKKTRSIPSPDAGQPWNCLHILTTSGYVWLT